MLAQLEAQRAYFASDEHLIECDDADALLGMKSPEELDRADAARRVERTALFQGRLGRTIVDAQPRPPVRAPKRR